jgi:hypothetical protein
VTSDDVDKAAAAIADMERNGGVTAWRLGGVLCGERMEERERVLAAALRWHTHGLKGLPDSDPAHDKARAQGEQMVRQLRKLLDEGV